MTEPITASDRQLARHAAQVLAEHPDAAVLAVQFRPGQDPDVLRAVIQDVMAYTAVARVGVAPLDR